MPELACSARMRRRRCSEGLPAVNCAKNRLRNRFCGKAYCFGIVRNGTGSEGVTKNADRLIEICGVVAICMELPRSADYVDKRALCNAKCL